MPCDHLTLEIEPRLAVVRLNRPAVRNALSQALMQELTAVCAGAGRAHRHRRRDPHRRQHLLHRRRRPEGRARPGPTRRLPLVTRRHLAGLGYRMCKAWEALPQISIVAIEGYAVGGGLALSLACDWRVLADDAWVSLPEIALGIPLTWGTIPRLVNLLGPARAKRLTILCERIAAPEALAMGLVDHTAPKGQALQAARDLAARTLAMPAAAVRMSKESVNAVATALNHAAGHMAHDQIALAASSDEAAAARAQALRQRS
jgi:enoyl-CoA hydratase